MKDLRHDMTKDLLVLNTESKRGVQCRYFILLNDRNISQFQVYLVGPDDGVYRFKLVKLHVTLSDQFPEVSPEVRFIHHTKHHIHPNFFVSGKMCLGLFEDLRQETWSKQLKLWGSRSVCHCMLLYIRRLLDDNPFKHEPWGQDKPELSHFVRYVTWDALLFRYLANETNTNALVWLRRYIQERGPEMLREL